MAEQQEQEVSEPTFAPRQGHPRREHGRCRLSRPGALMPADRSRLPIVPIETRAPGGHRLRRVLRDDRFRLVGDGG